MYQIEIESQDEKKKYYVIEEFLPKFLEWVSETYKMNSDNFLLWLEINWMPENEQEDMLIHDGHVFEYVQELWYPPKEE